MNEFSYCTALGTFLGLGRLAEMVGEGKVSPEYFLERFIATHADIDEEFETYKRDISLLGREVTK